MKTKITKKVLAEIKTLIDNHGYWSNEVKDYIGQFNYITAQKLHNKAHVYYQHGYGL